MTHNLNVGDRVVVESTLYYSTDAGLRPGTGRYLGREGVVEETTVGILDPRNVRVALDGIHRWGGDIMAPEGLIKVEDLPALAAERAPKFAVGDRVRISDPMKWRGDRGNLYTEARDEYFDGEEATVTSATDTIFDAGNVIVEETNGSGITIAVLPECLTLVEEEPRVGPLAESTIKPPTTVGTATVRVDVRLFVGDTDVTALLDAEALAGIVATAKEGSE